MTSLKNLAITTQKTTDQVLSIVWKHNLRMLDSSGIFTNPSIDAFLLDDVVDFVKKELNNLESESIINHRKPNEKCREEFLSSAKWRREELMKSLLEAAMNRQTVTKELADAIYIIDEVVRNVDNPEAKCTSALLESLENIRKKMWEEPVEIMDLTKDGITPEERKILCDKLHDNWPTRIAYRGQEFFDSFYLEQICKIAEKELHIGDRFDLIRRFRDSNENRSYRRNSEDEKVIIEDCHIDGQESYLGFIPEYDVFISGWDMNSEDENIKDDPNCVFLKYDEDTKEFQVLEDGQSFVEGASYSSELSNRVMMPEGNMMYSKVNTRCGGGMRPSVLEQLHQSYPFLIDLRLD